MSANFFNRIGQIGLGVALAGGVVNSALYNGEFIVLCNNVSKAENGVFDLL